MVIGPPPGQWDPAGVVTWDAMVTTPRELGSAAPHGASETGTPDPRFQPVSIRGPALIVLGIALIIVVAGVVASALNSGNAPTTSIQSIVIPGGTVVPLTPATTAMKSIVDRQRAAGGHRGQHGGAGRQPGHPRRQRRPGPGPVRPDGVFTTQLCTGQVVDLYRDPPAPARLAGHLRRERFGRRGGQGTEVLAKLGSGDGFYWEVGVVVSPTTSAGTTPFSVELFQLPDDQ